MAIILTIPIILNVVIFDTNDPPKDENNDDDSDDSKKIYWGVDSANSVDKALYQCVKDHFARPEVWGRYLGDKEDVSAGLNSDEAAFLHDKDVRILVIDNHFTDATGYDHGTEEAKQAISLAKELDVPEGVALFADIEPKFPVDSAFMQGWYDTVADSNYRPGLYGVFDEESALEEAFNATKQKTQENIIIWTAYPQDKITSKKNAPDYKPQGPDDSLLYGWQYAIDTNLFKKDMVDFLW